MTASADRSGRVEYPATSSLIGLGKDGKSANDSLGENPSVNARRKAKRVYVTRAHIEAIKEQLKGRQWSTLFDVWRVGVLSGRQVQRLYYGESAAGGRLARKHLSQLVQWRMIDRLERSVGGQRSGSAGYIYSLGPGGQRMLEPERKRYRPAWTPQTSYLRHALAVSELYTRLREKERMSDMELLAFDGEPVCWRRYFGPGGARSILKPDALAVVGIGNYEDRYFVEADCGTEPGTRITAKARMYVRYWQSGREQAETGVFPYVLWLAPDANRAAFLVDVLARLDPDVWQLFMVMTADEAADRIASVTTELTNNGKEVK
jgi:hypothetical protein